MPSASLVAKPLGQIAAFASRLFQAPSDNIRGIEPSAWYSPLQPVKPMADDEDPKGWQFYAGQNLIFTPRPDAEYSAWDLKQLATYPLARICIENVKDSISRIPWSVQLKRMPGESKKDHAKRQQGNKDIVKLAKFFERPDREHDWDDWLRPLLEDMLVIDAGTVLVRKTFSGEVAELRVLPGEMITRYIDDDGYTPMPPSPAYAQIWWGYPLVNMTTEQCIYRPRNIVRRWTISSQLYGMSPTEQLAQEIVPGQKRLEFVTNYYTQGSVPDVVQVVPKGVPPDKIAEAMQWMNSELAGNLAARRQWRMIQGFQDEGKPDQILFPKEKLLTDAFDEMHIRKICFGYGTSPQRLMRMMGTRNAAEQQEASENEGLIPWLEWVKNYRNHIIQVVFGFDDIESTYDAEREPDPEKQANRLVALSGKGIMTLNQAAEEIGNEPFDIPEADQPGIVTANGWVPVNAEHQLDRQKTLGTDPESEHKRSLEAEAAKPAPVVPDGPGRTSAQGKPNGKAVHSDKPAVMSTFGFAAVLDEPVRGYAEPLEDAAVCGRPRVLKRKHSVQIRTSAITVQSEIALRRFETVMHNRFKEMEAITARRLQKRLVKKIRKADDADETLRKIIDEIAAEWELVPDEVQDLYAQAALEGVRVGAFQISITDQDMIDKANTVAQEWARKRAAELVGMRRKADGTLVQNPNAEWAITESTRDSLRTIVTDLFAEDSPTLKDIEERITQAGIFSDTRASMIARTEISIAQNNGNMEGWKASGKVVSVDFQLSGDHDKDDECDDAADGGPYPLDEAPMPPLHPNCDCVLVLSEIEGDQQEEA